MAVGHWLFPWVACGLIATAAPAVAKKVRYDGAPPAPADTTFSTARIVDEPVVRARGPAVPPTNFQVIARVARTAFDRAIASCPVDSGTRVLLAPGESHPLNFMAEHAVLQALSRSGISARVRRSIIPDDSLAAYAAGGGEPVLEYQLASARVTYLRLRGWLPGRVKIERQGLVEGSLTLRDPGTASVLWTQDASFNLVDAFPRGRLSLVEDARFSELRSPAPGRSVDKAVEPIIVVGIVAGLVALFFQNRP
ncbi:MAG: hypothetical protein HOP12_15685 [Candidatus Eisenbacteria bacterium]|uniref:Uncharacterized protein n=1 Tax=Eiseniibacteriota bacterium TaxID=2212470 RepID=A0A849SLW5_UNCEI|nr:hypothetical protein [Candidatus Eisenbacteria bacterium]